MRRPVFLWIAVAISLFVAGLSAVGQGDQLSTCIPSRGVVDKTPGSRFTVEIEFKNTGSTEGSWSVNVAFESEKWAWSGIQHKLFLSPCSTKKLIWEGTVPANAQVNSTARLIAYYDDSVAALDWWIHVIPEAELTITSSTVR